MRTKRTISGGSDEPLTPNDQCKVDDFADDIDGSPDGGYSWVVLVCAICIQFIAGGAVLIGGVFVVEFKDAFGVSPGEAAWVAAINTGIAYGCSPLGGILSTCFGHRWVILSGALLTTLGLFLSSWATCSLHVCITYGLVGGIGIALQYSPSVSVVGLYFSKKKDLALGLTMSGAALGPLIYPMILRYLIDNYTWRGALMIFAGITLQASIFAALIFPPHLFNPRTKRKPAFSRQDSTWREITSIEVLKDPIFFILFINNLMWCIGISPLWALLPDYALVTGMSRSVSSMLITFAGLGNALGRALSAVVMQYFPLINKLHMHAAVTVLGGFLLAVYPIDGAFLTFATNSISLGLLWGMLVGTLPVVTSDLLGAKSLTNAFAYLMIADGLGFLMGPPISGVIYKATSSYTVPFIFNASMYSLSGCVILAVLLLKRHKTNDSLLEVVVGDDIVKKPLDV